MVKLRGKPKLRSASISCCCGWVKSRFSLIKAPGVCVGLELRKLTKYRVNAESVTGTACKLLIAGNSTMRSLGSTDVCPDRCHASMWHKRRLKVCGRRPHEEVHFHICSGDSPVLRSAKLVEQESASIWWLDRRLLLMDEVKITLE